MYKFNVWETSKLEIPQPEIKIIQTIVIENPFREAIKEIKKQKEENQKGYNQKIKKKEFFIEKDGDEFILPERKKKNISEENIGLGLTKFLIDSNQLQENAEFLMKNKLKKK